MFDRDGRLVGQRLQGIQIGLGKLALVAAGEQVAHQAALGQQRDRRHRADADLCLDGVRDLGRYPGAEQVVEVVRDFDVAGQRCAHGQVLRLVHGDVRLQDPQADPLLHRLDQLGVGGDGPHGQSAFLLVVLGQHGRLVAQRRYHAVHDLVQHLLQIQRG